jgi:hypothetical protein
MQVVVVAVGLPATQLGALVAAEQVVLTHLVVALLAQQIQVVVVAEVVAKQPEALADPVLLLCAIC